MITKEHSSSKKCCFYASDFHLEMILLPYIKERIDKSNFVIFTQNDLSDTVETLLEKTNLNIIDKNKILELNWKNNDKDKIEDIKLNQDKNINIIIKGEQDYIKQMNEDIESFVNKDTQVIDCFKIDEVNIKEIENQYDEILNTSRM